MVLISVMTLAEIVLTRKKGRCIATLFIGDIKLCRSEGNTYDEALRGLWPKMEDHHIDSADVKREGEVDGVGGDLG